MQISLVIPAYNEQDYIAACIKSILRHAPKELLEIIVVDNGSMDKTAEIAARHRKVVVLHEKKKGPSCARQCGLLAAKGDIVAFIDADTKITPNWFQVLMKEFRHHPKTLAITGPLDFYDLAPLKRKMISGFWKNMGIITFAFTKQVVYGANFAARRTALQSIGGFDTSLEFFSEDTDIGRRINNIGILKFIPEFTAHTSGRRLEKQGVVHTSFMYGLNFLSAVIFHKPASEKHEDFR